MSALRAGRRASTCAALVPLVGAMLLAAPLAGAAGRPAEPDGPARLPLAAALEILPIPESATGVSEPGNDAERPRGAAAPFVQPLSEGVLVAGPASAAVATPAESEPREVAQADAGTVPGSGISATVDGDGEFLPADELDVPLPSGPRPESGALGSGMTPSSPRRNWGLAPLRWGGVLSAGFRRRSHEDSESTDQQVYEGRLRVNSYIMKPYIALVSGDFGLAFVRSQSDGGGGSDMSGTSINGSGTLSVFPQSRFPFQATLSLSDSRTDGTLTSSNIERRRLGLRQDYRPLLGNWRSSLQYDRSELKGDFGLDTVDRIAASFSGMTGRHNFTSNGSFSRNVSDDSLTDDLFALGTHTYRIGEAASVNTSASFTRQEFSFDDENFDFDGTTQSAQVFSYLSWTPADSKWRGTGNLRYFETESESGQGSLGSRSFGGSGSLTYLATRNLSLFGSVGANRSSRGGTSTTQSLGLNYSSDPWTFADKYVYSWSGATAASNTTTTESDGEDARALNASLGHGVTRTWQPSDFTFINGSVNQSIGSSRTTGLESISSNTLTHSASVSVQANNGDQMSGFASASISDSRVTGDLPSTFQMLNVQLSGRWRINAYSELNSNLTWQLSRRDTTTEGVFLLTDEFGNPILIDTRDQSRNSSLTGNIGYLHVRAFGVRNLRYTLDFRANTAQDDARRRFGDPDAERDDDRATLDLDQRLRYTIGRLDAELQMRVAEIEGRRNALVFFRVSRYFGAF